MLRSRPRRQFPPVGGFPGGEAAPGKSPQRATQVTSCPSRGVPPFRHGLKIECLLMDAGNLISRLSRRFSGAKGSFPVKGADVPFSSSQSLFLLSVAKTIVIRGENDKPFFLSAALLRRGRRFPLGTHFPLAFVLRRTRIVLNFSAGGKKKREIKFSFDPTKSNE